MDARCWPPRIAATRKLTCDANHLGLGMATLTLLFDEVLALVEFTKVRRNVRCQFTSIVAMAAACESFFQSNIGCDDLNSGSVEVVLLCGKSSRC
jgi:hypothetical protein